MPVGGWRRQGGASLLLLKRGALCRTGFELMTKLGNGSSGKAKS
jgi:hypothetical protein